MGRGKDVSCLNPKRAEGKGSWSGAPDGERGGDPQHHRSHIDPHQAAAGWGPRKENEPVGWGPEIPSQILGYSLSYNIIPKSFRETEEQEIAWFLLDFGEPHRMGKEQPGQANK